MQRATWLTCCWPGLAQLWLRGEWRGLVTATAFAIVFNLGLAATFIWPQWWPGPWCQALWYGLGITWLIMAVRSYRFVASFQELTTINEQPVSANEKQHDFFIQAQAEYLKRNWFEAEQWLSKAISRNAYDTEALLLLVTLYRHTGREDEAKQVLQHMRTMERTDKWHWELERERELLDSLRGMDDASQSAEMNMDVNGHLTHAG